MDHREVTRRLSAFWNMVVAQPAAVQIVAPLVLVATMYGAFLLAFEGGGPVSPDASAPALSASKESDDADLSRQAVIAGLYIALLGVGAVLIKRRKSLAMFRKLPQAAAEGAIVVIQKTQVSAHLTLLLVEVSGKKVLVASSPRSVSTTVLDSQ